MPAKTVKKSAKKAAGRAKPAAKKTAKKSAARRAAAKPAGKASARSAAPSPVRSGRGATPAEIGADLVRLANAGKDTEVWTKWWSKDVESIEGGPEAMAWRGRAAVIGKCEWWMSRHEILGASAEGPYVGGTGFAVKFRMDVREKETGKRWQMEEVGVFTVKDGKIVREEFMYGAVQPSPAGA